MAKWIGKLKWVAGVALVFALIVMTNLSDASDFRRVKASLVTVYEDRVVASDILFRMSRLVAESRLAARTAEPADTVATERFVALLDDLVAEFSATRLTRKEERIFGQLKADVRRLRDLPPVVGDQAEDFLDVLKSVDEDLAALSQIQVREGRNQLLESTRISERYELFTRLEIIVLVVLALGILFVIMYEPSGRRGDRA